MAVTLHYNTVSIHALKMAQAATIAEGLGLPRSKWLFVGKEFYRIEGLKGPTNLLIVYSTAVEYENYSATIDYARSNGFTIQYVYTLP